MSLKPPIDPTSLFEEVITPSYGTVVASPTGIAAIDNLSVQQALASAALSNGGRILFQGGTYKLTSSFTLTSNIALELNSDTILDMSGAATSTILFKATGTEDATVALTANAVAGATSLSVAAGAESGFAVNDIIRIGSTLQYDPGRTNTPVGELAFVLSTASGVINLRSPLVGPLAYNTADSAVVSKITPVRNISANGSGKIQGGGTGSTHQGFQFDRCFGVHVSNVQFDLVENVAVQAYNSIDINVNRIHVERSNRSGTGYGVEFGYACQDCTVTNSYFRDCRHGTTTGSATTFKGFPRRCSFINNKIVDTVADGMDNHGAGDDMTFIGNTIIDAGNNGINTNCPTAIIQDNTIIRPTLHGVQVRNFADGPVDYTIDNNRIINTTGIGITVETSGNTHGTTMGSVAVTNNKIRLPGTKGIEVISLDTARLDTVNVSGNTIDGSGNTYAIQVQKSDNATIIGNRLMRITATLTAMNITDVQESSVSANVVKFINLSTGTGILVSTGIDVAVTGNIVKLGGTGIRFDNASNNCTVFGNNVRGCSTPLNMGAGAGHISTTADAAGAYNRT